MENKITLIGMTLEELQGVAQRGKMPRFVGKQLAEWIYDKKVVSFDEMANISKKNKQWLSENYEIGREAPSAAHKSSDGTVKYLFKVGNGNAIESVYIPDKDRATLCVSSQVGCKMNCYFCATGRMGFKANLTASQIINQVLSIPPAPQKGWKWERHRVGVYSRQGPRDSMCVESGRMQDELLFLCDRSHGIQGKSHGFADN